ncbi:MAG: hypothetical protein WKG07_46585 [Hymenobacter sp.]
MRTREQEVEPLVNLSEITEVELLDPQADARIHDRRARQHVSRHGLRLRRPARLGRPATASSTSTGRNPR